MALSADRLTKRRKGEVYSLPVAANAVIYAGALVCVNASGYAVPGSTSTTLKAAGVAQEAVTGTATAGAVSVLVLRDGWHLFKNSSSGDAIALADINASCFIVDDETVAKTNGSSTRSVAGIIRDVDAAGVWVEI